MGIKFNPLSGQFDLVGSGGGAVDSVNGQTGVVVLDTGDVASVIDSRYVTDADLVVIGNTSGVNTGDQFVPTLTSQLTNDSGFLTSNAVSSVNGATGVVVLDADDIDDAATTQKFVTAPDLTILSNTSGINTGDQTSIVGISGTMAEFNTAVTDGNILFNDEQGLGFRFENRTSDPGTPTVGQVWLRTDL